MNVEECRMCGGQQKLNYLFLPKYQGYIDYLRDYTKTQVHKQDKKPPFVCLNCMDWLDGHYAKKKKHDKNRRTCQQHPAIGKLLLDDDPYQNLSEELDLQPLWEIPEDYYYRPINKFQTYQCDHCNYFVNNKDVIAQHLVEVHLVRCTFPSRCQLHCPIKTRYSKVTVYKDPENNRPIGATVMGTSGQFWKNPAFLYLRTDRAVPMASDDAAKNAAGAEMDVAYKCHKCRTSFASSWQVEQHILHDHFTDDRCSKCYVHCRKMGRKQRISVKRLRNTKAQNARNAVRYVVALLNYPKWKDLS